MRSLVLPLAAAALALAAPATAFAPSSLTRGAPPATPTLNKNAASSTANPAPFRPATFISTRGDSTTQLYMGWGPDPIWSTATVDSNDAACPSKSCVALSVTVPRDTAAEFKIPGQYVQVRPVGDEEAKPIFLAIASAPTGVETDDADAAAGSDAEPTSTTFEFLIKKTDGNEWITAADASSTLDVSQVLGGGFPTEENMEGFKYDFPAQNVLLFATGSGIAPIRSAIESGLLGLNEEGKKGGRTARLYYGVRTPSDMPYAELFYEWEKAGVEVVPVISQPEDGKWEGRTGYVQNALEEDGVAIPRNSGALMCGVKGMTESVKEILTKAGVFEGRVMTNF